MNPEKSNRLFILAIAAGLLLVGTTVFLQGQSIMKMQKSLSKTAEKIDHPVPVQGVTEVTNGLSERLDFIEKYIDTLPNSRSSTPVETHGVREFGISLKLPADWTQQQVASEEQKTLWLNPPEYLHSQGHPNPCEIRIASEGEIEHFKDARPGDACRGVDGPCIDFEKRTFITDGKRPVILLEYNGGWMGRQQYVGVDLPGSDVVMRNFWSGDVINGVQARLNENLQDICVEIAKTIDVMGLVD